MTDNFCNYEWEATFTNVAGEQCIAGEGGAGADPLSLGTDNNTTLTSGACASTGTLVVDVRGSGVVYVDDCISAGVEDFPNTADDCDTGDPGNQAPDSGDIDTGTRRATVDDTTEKAAEGRAASDPVTGEQRNAGAVGNTTFTVTATPEEGADGKVPEGCEAVSEDTELVYTNNGAASSGGLQRATLTVVDLPLGVASTATSGFCLRAGHPVRRPRPACRPGGPERHRRDHPGQCIERRGVAHGPVQHNRRSRR